MNSLPQIIRDEIAARGVLPFARFMELALYCPEYGYYEQQKDTVGRHGDFITSVSAGGLFGQLLAFQFAAWLAELPAAAGGGRIVEAGAHDGRLAADVLGWLRAHRPRLFGQLEYTILEPSPRRRAWQRETLREFAPRVTWAEDFAALAGAGRPAPLPGVIFSNELLDAFPVRRLGWDAGSRTWFEWGVQVAGPAFAWAKIELQASGILNPELEAVLPDNYSIELSPAAEQWWRDAAGSLSCGRLVTIDYGLRAEELFSPARTKGTLRAYFRQRPGDDLLANPGEQDLTAHVNFAALQTAGEAAGLRTESLQTQPQFLARILEQAVREKSFQDWSPARARQFHTLTHPEHLGRAFRVLIQSR